MTEERQVHEERKGKMDWRPGDIMILHHPDPEVLKKAREFQEQAKQQRIKELQDEK